MNLTVLRCSLNVIFALTLALLPLGQSAWADNAATPKAAAGSSVVDEDDMIPDTKESATFDYHCDMKEALTIYTNADDNEHLALRWKGHIYRLKRIATTTGANRFENKKAGLVWIGIPSKGMLLDSKHGQQLANECKTIGQS